MKPSSKDILGILRRFKIADENNVPRHIESIKTTQPSPINTLTSFVFFKKQYYILLDSSAEDDVEYIVSQIKKDKSDILGELLVNPGDTDTYAMPWMGKECYLFVVNNNKKRIDSELAERYPENSRSTWQKYIKAGYVSINGKVVTSPKTEVSTVDSVSINLAEATDFTKHELPILYIDNNVIVVNKPEGVLTHAKGVLNDEFTVAEFFKRYSSFGLDTNRPGIVHRLDRDTSGVIIGARNTETAKLLQKQFADRKTKKTYYAVLSGIPKLDKAIIDLPIGRNPSKPSTFKVDPKGKMAKTQYEVLAKTDNYALVKLQPLTGRTHQLRVHMKYLNTPILGDKVYGKESKRLYLHAYSLEITIPNGERKTFTAPLPKDIAKFFPDIKL